MKERLYSQIKRLTILFVIGIAYCIWVLLTGIRIPCIFYEATGFLCPACGITRMITAAVKLDFAAAYSYNKLIFLTWPMILLPIFYSEIRYVRVGKRSPGRLGVLLWIEIFLLVLFGIVRNVI